MITRHDFLRGLAAFGALLAGRKGLLAEPEELASFKARECLEDMDWRKWCLPVSVPAQAESTFEITDLGAANIANNFAPFEGIQFGFGRIYEGIQWEFSHDDGATWIEFGPDYDTES